MQLNFLPNKINSAISYLNYNYLYEIRLRIGFPIKIIYDNKLDYLYRNEDKSFNNKILCLKTDVDYIIDKLTDSCLYAFSDMIENGVLVSNEGHRVGLCGEFSVTKNNKLNYRKISSLNIRIPHEIFNCGKYIYDKLLIDNLKSVLIISPPLFGKTTLLKDLIRIINQNKNINILVLDERGELVNVLGENVDKLSLVDKSFGLNIGVRNLSPQLIVMDELMNDFDMLSVKNLINSGINVIATCHGKDINDLLNKQWFLSGYFDYYVLINEFNKQIIYNRELNCI